MGDLCEEPAFGVVGVFDLYEYDSETLEREMILENTVDAFLGPISPDGSHAALSKVHLRSDTDILLWSRETGDITPLVADEGEVANSPETFSADGTHFVSWHWWPTAHGVPSPTKKRSQSQFPHPPEFDLPQRYLGPHFLSALPDVLN